MSSVSELKKLNDYDNTSCCVIFCLIFISIPFLIFNSDFGKYLFSACVIFIIFSSIYSHNKRAKIQIKAEFQKKETELATSFYYVVENYNSLINELNQRGQKFDIYKKHVKNIFQKDIELNTKLMELRIEEEKYRKLIDELKHSFSISDKENKNNIPEEHLKLANDKYQNYKKCTEEIKNAIRETAQDFLYVKSEIILNEASTSEKTLTILKTKHQELKNIQNKYIFM